MPSMARVLTRQWPGPTGGGVLLAGWRCDAGTICPSIKYKKERKMNSNSSPLLTFLGPPFWLKLRKHNKYKIKDNT